MGFNELYKIIMCENNVDDDDRINIEKKINEYTGLSSDEYKLNTLYAGSDIIVKAVCKKSNKWDYLVFYDEDEGDRARIYGIDEITFDDFYHEVNDELRISKFFNWFAKNSDLTLNFDNAGLLNIILRFDYYNESVDFSEKLKSILKKSNLEIPDREYNSYKKFDVDDNGNIIASDGRHSNIMKIGNFVTTLYPDLKIDNKKSELNKIIGKIRSNLTNDGYEFIIDDDVAGCYEDDDMPKSCMTGKEFVIDFYESQPDIKMVKLLFNNKIVGRALLWTKVNGAKGGLFLDRVYPTGDDKIINLFHEYAKKNDWSYRGSNNINDYFSIENCDSTKLFVKLNNKDDIKLVPYLDTFRFGFINNEFITNVKGNGTSYTFGNTNGTSLKKWGHSYKILSIGNIDEGLNLLNEIRLAGGDFDYGDFEDFEDVEEEEYRSEEHFLDMYPENFSIEAIIDNSSVYELINFFLSKEYLQYL